METLTKQAPTNRAERRKDEKWERGATARKRVSIMKRAELDNKELKRQGREKRIEAVRERTAKRKAEAKKK